MSELQPCRPIFEDGRWFVLNYSKHLGAFDDENQCRAICDVINELRLTSEIVSNAEGRKVITLGLEIARMFQRMRQEFIAPDARSPMCEEYIQSAEAYLSHAIQVQQGNIDRKGYDLLKLWAEQSTLTYSPENILWLEHGGKGVCPMCDYGADIQGHSADSHYNTLKEHSPDCLLVKIVKFLAQPSAQEPEKKYGPNLCPRCGTGLPHSDFQHDCKVPEEEKCLNPEPKHELHRNCPRCGKPQCGTYAHKGIGSGNPSVFWHSDGSSDNCNGSDQ